MFELVKKNGDFLERASLKLKEDKQLVTEAIKSKGMAL